MERLQKIIASSGYCSRRKAEELISSGEVQVNGETIRELGTKANYSDHIVINGISITKKEEKEYYILNKPRGVITSTTDDKKRKTVVDLINTKARIYPVGRLDYDTTGVLLLTNDGDLTNKLLHPSNMVEKVYVAKIDGILLKTDIEKLCKGVIINGKKTSKARAKIKKIDKKNNTCIVELVIHEGKNHQVKNMFEAINYTVIKLKREQFGLLTASGLKSGEYRPLSIKEIKTLYGEFAKQKSS